MAHTISSRISLLCKLLPPSFHNSNCYVMAFLPFPPFSGLSLSFLAETVPRTWQWFAEAISISSIGSLSERLVGCSLNVSHLRLNSTVNYVYIVDDLPRRHKSMSEMVCDRQKAYAASNPTIHSEGVRILRTVPPSVCVVSTNAINLSCSNKGYLGASSSRSNHWIVRTLTRKIPLLFNTGL